MALTKERAERIARGHPCANCQEYTYRKLTVKPAPQSILDELGAVFVVTLVCGVCGYHGEIGIQDDGDIVYQS